MTRVAQLNCVLLLLLFTIVGSSRDAVHGQQPAASPPAAHNATLPAAPPVAAPPVAAPPAAATPVAAPPVSVPAAAPAAAPLGSTPPASLPASAPPASLPASATPATTPATAGDAPPSPLPPEINDNVRGLVTAMENAEKSLGRMKELGDDIGRLRNDVEHVIAKTTEVADGLRPRRDEVKRQIDKLGPAPGKDAPAEDAGIAGERARLNAEATALDGAIKTLELTWVRARQTIDKITDLRLAIFTKSLMERMASPLLPSMWNDVLRDLPQTSRLVGYIGADWLSSLKRQPVAVLLLLAAAVAFYLLAKLFVSRLTRHRRPQNVPDPSFFARAAAASWMAPLRALPAMLTALLVYGGLEALGALYYPSQSIASAALRSVIIFAAVAALIRSVLTPTEARQRLVSLSDRSSRRLNRYLIAMAGVYSADLALTSIGRSLYLPLSMSVLQSLIAALAFAVLLIGLLLTTFEPYGVPVGEAPPRDRPGCLNVPPRGHR